MMKTILFTGLVILAANLDAAVVDTGTPMWSTEPQPSPTETTYPATEQTTLPTTDEPSTTSTTTAEPTSTTKTPEPTATTSTTEAYTASTKSATLEPVTTTERYTTKETIPTTETPNDDFSYICGDTGVFIAPHPRDCHLFIFCNYGTWQIRRCFFNLYYSPELQMCVLPDFSGCTMK